MSLISRCAAVMALTVLSTAGLVPTAQARPTWDTTPAVSHRNPSPTPKVVDLRWGEHPRFDRVVIDLRGKLPGYRVQYVRVLRYDPGGQRVRLPGRRHISIALRPAVAHNNQGDSVYQGPMRRRLNLPVLRGVAFTGDFEGVVSLGLALSRRADFRVFVVHAPNRIVIDLRH